MFARDDEICYKFWDTQAMEERTRCVKKGEGFQEVQLEHGPIYKDEFGAKLECRGVEDEAECFARHGVDIENRVHPYR